MPKRRTRKEKEYFGVVQEEAVNLYLASKTEEEKNKIFNEYLKEPLSIMVECIIRRYKLYRKGVEFNDLLSDTLSFLMTKVDKFDSTKNHKAYSYFGTICKHYLMGSMEKDTKEMNRTTPYDDISSDVEDDINHAYYIDDVEIDYSNVIDTFINKLSDFIENEKLNENEVKLGYALVDIFRNYEFIFQIGEGNKFNKNLILLSIRDMTSLSTKEIRVSMRKYKKLYNGVLVKFLE